MPHTLHALRVKLSQLVILTFGTPVLFAALALASHVQQASAAEEPVLKYPLAEGRLVFDRVRFKPAPGFERDMIGGKFTGSNVSSTEGYEVLAEITTAPAANEWTEMTFDGKRPHRWIRYEAPPGSFGHIGKLEFYAGQRRLGGPGFGSIGRRTPGHDWPRVFDPKPNSWFDSDKPDGNYVGIDTQDFATAVRPIFEPEPADFDAPLTVTLRTPTPGAKIRYTLDGTTPSATAGLIYEKPLVIHKTTTLVAVSLKEGFAPSSPTAGTYLAVPPKQPELTTFHIGNSITQTTNEFAKFARTAGYRHRYERFVRPGIWTNALWEKHASIGEESWKASLDGLDRIDHFTVQPRDMDVAHEAEHEILFFDLIRKKSPDMQPWLYAEWTDIYRTHPTNRGEVPSPCTQMQKLYPALTWEEACSAWLLYVEEVQHKVLETYKTGKRPRIIPVSLTLGWVKNLVDHGKVPGLGPDAFEKLVFFDCVHPGKDGAYLVDMTWYAAFYGQSPEGRVLPIGTTFTAEQAAGMQRLAWDVVQNYPDCGVYEEGSEPVGTPQFSPAAGKLADVTPVTLSSSTPGAWFRYTLDGTEPTRTRGYIYCGVISVRPGMTVRAIAYRSGMADSPTSEARF